MDKKEDKCINLDDHDHPPKFECSVTLHTNFEDKDCKKVSLGDCLKDVFHMFIDFMFLLPLDNDIMAKFIVLVHESKWVVCEDGDSVIIRKFLDIVMMVRKNLNISESKKAKAAVNVKLAEGPGNVVDERVLVLLKEMLCLELLWIMHNRLPAGSNLSQLNIDAGDLGDNIEEDTSEEEDEDRDQEDEDREYHLGGSNLDRIELVGVLAQGTREHFHTIENRTSIRSMEELDTLVDGAVERHYGRSYLWMEFYQLSRGSRLRILDPDREWNSFISKLKQIRVNFS